MVRKGRRKGKFSFVFHRKSSTSGPLPERRRKIREIGGERERGEGRKKEEYEEEEEEEKEKVSFGEGIPLWMRRTHVIDTR